MKVYFPKQIPVSAIQLRFNFTMHYDKWGSTQQAKPFDWLVDTGEDVYTVDKDSFADTYKPIGPGRYVKVAPVWAEPATITGEMKTKEGVSVYTVGDMLVYNQPNRQDGYCMPAEKFFARYQEVAT